MENEELFLNVNSSSSSSSSSSNRIQPCHLDSNCETSMDHTAFKPALSSIVSSPSSSNTTNPSECIAIRELIGKLGNICNSGQIPPPFHSLHNSSNAFFCNSSLTFPSQPKISWEDGQISGNLPILGNSNSDHQNLELFTSDPRFTGRGTRISCYNISNYDQLQGLFVSNEQEFTHKTILKTRNGNPSRDLINISIRGGIHMGSLENDSKFQRVSKYSTPENSETDNAREESYISHHPAENQDETNGRKRKTIFRSKVRESPSSSPSPCIKDDVKKAEEDAIAKRRKISEGKGNPENDINPKEEEGERSKSTVGERRWKDRSKSVDPPKQDFIHVRARRGQATDSHSLAERVRREKISERMKFLQGLVPGCNKVTGKAVMLDEIINYVQSLQRQVEFLSMKLANINPSLNFNTENLLSKDIQCDGSLQSCPFTSSLPFPFVQLPESANFQSIDLNGYDIQSSVHPLNPILSQDLGIHHTSNDIYANPWSQIPGYWEDELQTVVHVGFEQKMNQTFSQQSFNGGIMSLNSYET